MSAIARAIQSVNINPRSFFLAGAILLGVFGLFIIPELVGNSTPKHHPMGAVVSGEQQQAMDTAVEAGSSEGDAIPQVTGDEAMPLRVSPLDEIIIGMEAKEQVALAAAPAAAPAETASSEVEGAPVPAPQTADASLRTDPITWDKLSSPEMVQALNNARSESILISQKLKAAASVNSATLFSLLSYQNGIQLVSDGAQLTASFGHPEEALSYLEQLDADVTRRLVEDGVGEDVMERWTRVSLGPLLSGSRAARMKERLKKPFNPQLTVGHLRISVTQNGRKSFASVYGYFKGETVTKLTVYRNGRSLGGLRFEKPDDLGWRYFSFLAARTASGVFTFRVEGKYGEIYEKSYKFLPNVNKFRRLRSGTYEIPLNNEYGPSPKLDRIFAMGAKVKIGDKVIQLGQGGDRPRAKIPKDYISVDFEPKLDASWESF